MYMIADMSAAIRRFLFNALKQVIVPALGAVVLAYFGYYAVHGDRGILAKHRLEDQIAEARQLLADVRFERERLEVRANRLRRDRLDVDLLDERARDMLNYAYPRDLIVPLPQLYQPENGGE